MCVMFSVATTIDLCNLIFYAIFLMVFCESSFLVTLIFPIMRCYEYLLGQFIYYW